MKAFLALLFLVGLSSVSLSAEFKPANGTEPQLLNQTDPRLNETCSFDSDCRLHNTTCRQGKCQCALGSLEYHKSICRPEYCENNAICVQLFGENTFCQADHKCVCKDTAVLDHATQKCIAKVNGYDRGIPRETIKLRGNSTKCPVGYLPAKTETSDCIKMPCMDDKDCTLVFGSNTTCDKYYHFCQCDQAHVVDVKTQKCTVQVGPELNTTCFSDLDCPITGSECIQGLCQCKLGEELYRKDRCLTLFCGTNSQCQTKFGPNTVCNWPSGCKCEDSYKFNRNTKKCEPYVNQLSSSCFRDSECSASAACIDYECQCKLGFIQDGSSKYNCKQMQCYSDAECSAKFTGSNCLYNSCSCSWDHGYTLEESSQKCKARSTKIGKSCWLDGDCGLGANCVLGQCRCQSGYKGKDNDMDCKPAICTFDTDCELLDINSNCQFSSCSCKDGYTINYDLQVCQPQHSYDWYTTSSVSTFAMISLLSICLGLIIISLRHRRVAPRAAARRAAIVSTSAKVSLPQKS